LNCETPLLQPFIGDSFSFDIVAFLQKMNVDIEELKKANDQLKLLNSPTTLLK
jgi:hypothetical protein